MQPIIQSVHGQCIANPQQQERIFPNESDVVWSQPGNRPAESDEQQSKIAVFREGVFFGHETSVRIKNKDHPNNAYLLNAEIAERAESFKSIISRGRHSDC